MDEWNQLGRRGNERRENGRIKKRGDQEGSGATEVLKRLEAQYGQNRKAVL